MYAVFWEPKPVRVGDAGVLGDCMLEEDEDWLEPPIESAEISVKALEEAVVDGVPGTLGRVTPSSSPSRSISSSSELGKKLRNNASACHGLAFLNSTQTSMRPGRESAGSRRSR